MDKIRIYGGQPLKGKIKIEGAKNAALPLMAACLVTEQPIMLRNVPRLHDIQTMIHLLTHLGMEVNWQEEKGKNTLSLQAKALVTTHAPYDIVRKMRASVLVLGPLLARQGEAFVSLPGGCAIGARPVDVHIRGLQALGADVTLEDGYNHARAPNGLRGGSYTFPKVSVTGTENLLITAVLANGTTELIHAAREPEVTDLAHFLNRIGARIEGIGTDVLTIQGVTSLQKTTYTVIADRIETGTYLIAAAITEGELFLENTTLALGSSVSSLLEQMGVQLHEKEGRIFVKSPPPKTLRGVDMVTEPFPGFATDLQAQLMALMTLVNGSTLVTESIFENRFMHVAELMRMGADITIQGHSALIRGVSFLKGAPVMATDLRASVSLVLAGLAAQGETILNRIYHLDRGYQDLELKLAACGAHIERLSGEEAQLLEMLV